MDYKEVILKLVGKTRPIGDHAVDAERFENQEQLEKVIVELVLEMKAISVSCKGRKEYSVQKAGKRASEFLTFLTRNYL